MYVRVCVCVRACLRACVCVRACASIFICINAAMYMCVQVVIHLWVDFSLFPKVYPYVQGISKHFYVVLQPNYEPAHVIRVLYKHRPLNWDSTPTLI